MRLRWVQQILATLFACSFLSSIGAAQPRTTASLLEDLRSKNPDRVQSALESFDDFEGDSAELVPELITLIDAGEYPTLEKAIRALSNIPLKANRAIPSLCKKLADNRYWIRSLAVDSLVAIGNDSVASVKELLQGNTPEARAAAIHVLGRLKSLNIDDLDRLISDPDPRVRGAVAYACSFLGKPAVNRIVFLLGDAETAVSVEAARSLKSNQEDPSLAVPGLTRVLTRPDVFPIATSTLASYGIAAQRAIPALIQSYPEEPASEDPALPNEHPTNALLHIGPPHEDDVLLLCDCLQHVNLEARTLAAEQLQMLGPKAEAAIPALIAAFEEALRLNREFRATKAQIEEDENDETWRFSNLAHRSSIAIWYITGNIGQLFERIRIVEAECGDSMGSGEPVWSDLDSDAVPALEQMLREENYNIRSMALHALSSMGAKATAAITTLTELVDDRDDDIAALAWQAIADIRPVTTDVIEQKLLTKIRQDKISSLLFSIVTMQLKLQSPEIIAALEERIGDSPPILMTLGSVSTDHRRTASFVIDSANRGLIDHDVAIEALQRLKLVDDLLIPYLTARLDDHHVEECVRALAVFSTLETRDNVPLAKIETLLNDDDQRISLGAAQVIFIITKNRIPMDKRLSKVLKTPRDEILPSFYFELSTIAEMRQSGDSFVGFVRDAIRISPEETLKGIETLEAIGTASAIEELQSIAQSKDWIYKSEAARAIHHLRSRSSNDQTKDANR